MSQPCILLALAALTACAARAPESTVDEPQSLRDGTVSYGEWQDNKAAGDEALRLLKELNFIEIGALIVDAPDASSNCYGPCEDDATDQVWMQEHAWQVARLQSLTKAATAIAAQSPSADPQGRQHDVNALAALQVVEIGQLTQSGNCYALVCPDDLIGAGVVKALAEQTTGL